jgi:hypothetical protein
MEELLPLPTRVDLFEPSLRALMVEHQHSQKSFDLQRKVPQNRHVRCEDTTVVAVINHRAEPDVTNQFENISIEDREAVYYMGRIVPIW